MWPRSSCAEGDAGYARRAVSGGISAGAEPGLFFVGLRAPVSWPYRIGVMPGQAESFQRRGVAAVLDEAVADGGSAVLCQVLAGTGGVGKTQLAAAYARAAWQAGTVDLLAWVTAGSRDAVVAAYAQAGVEVAALTQVTRTGRGTVLDLAGDHRPAVAGGPR